MVDAFGWLKIRQLGSPGQGVGQEAVAQVLVAENGIVQGKLFYEKTCTV